MNRLKNLYHQLMTYLGRYTKRPKKKGSPNLKVANKKTVNLAVLSGLAFILLVGLLGGIRAMTLSNKVSNLEKEIATANSKGTKTTTTSTIDNRLQYYLNDFVYWYFTIPEDADGQTEQAEKVNSFYGAEPDIQSQGQVKNPSKLDWSRLLTVKDNVATYEVHYIQIVKDGDKSEEQKIVTAFNIPYTKTNNGYYVSGLPWFESLSSSQDKTADTKESVKLNKSDNLSETVKKKLDKFLELFFTNYTSDQDNLDLVSNNLTCVENTKFKSLDYSYYKVTEKTVIAYAQATFEVAGTTHSENFTLTLSKKGKSYYVNQLKHYIPTDYAKSE